MLISFLLQQNISTPHFLHHIKEIQQFLSNTARVPTGTKPGVFMYMNKKSANLELHHFICCIPAGCTNSGERKKSSKKIYTPVL
jgi:hypothetical protein